MSTHSIFSRQWWTVSLRATFLPSLLPRQRLERLVGQIAEGLGGRLQADLKAPKVGAVIATIDEPAAEGAATASASVVLLQTPHVYFPLPEDELESGTVAFESIRKCDRDFPRRLTGGKDPLFQYPLLVAFSGRQPERALFVVSSPYFFLLKDVLSGLRPGRNFSFCIGIDVARAFSQLKTASAENGAVEVRSGRMVVTGIENLRLAVFSGDNVILSPLYAELTRRPGVEVHPKDCRLRRSYNEPVGGNRRPFVSWFDSNGNFRLTPGSDPTSALYKFVDLMDVLSAFNLAHDAETFNPLTKIGPITRVQ